MNPIIEAMARAHWESDRKRQHRLLHIELMSFDALPQFTKEALVIDMRAALRAAMECEPTRAMVLAHGQPSPFEPSDSLLTELCAEDWRALLGAVVEE